MNEKGRKVHSSLI